MYSTVSSGTGRYFTGGLSARGGCKKNQKNKLGREEKRGEERNAEKKEEKKEKRTKVEGEETRDKTETDRDGLMQCEKATGGRRREKRDEERASGRSGIGEGVGYILLYVQQDWAVD